MLYFVENHRPLKSHLSQFETGTVCHHFHFPARKWQMVGENGRRLQILTISLKGCEV